MAKSKITITFISIPSVGDYIEIGNSLASYLQDIKETFVNLRSNNQQSTIGTGLVDSAGYFYDSLRIDYLNSGLYDFNGVNNVVTITSKLSNAVFSLDTIIGDFCTVSIENFTEPITISITDISFSTFLADPQNKVNVNVTTSVLANNYTRGNTVVNPNTSNPIVYQILRGQDELFIANRIDSGETSSVSYNVMAPGVLLASNITIDLINTTSGYTAAINVSSSRSLLLQYSLDASIWQSKNVFTGLARGNYTLYVKDQFGVIVNKDFSVEPGLELKEEFSYISKSMSIRYKMNQEWDYNDIHRTSENTLSCEENAYISYKYKQLFKPINVVKTQFLSNYKNISANVIKSNGLKDSLNIVNKINLLDIKDKRDARIYAIESVKTGVYFTGGNTYDYYTSIDNGNYALNGALPDYGAINEYIGIGEEGSFLIEDIIYDESKNADVLVISRLHSEEDSLAIVYSSYNKKNFNVYEFTVDFSQYNNQEIQVEILQSSEDDGFAPCNYLSEVLEVSDYFHDCVEIKWANELDTNVFYSTDIHNIGNYEFTSFVLDKDSSLEIHKTPYTSIVIEANNYELKKLLIEGLSTEIAQQLIQASLHKYLCINNQNFISHEPAQLSHIENTNLYSVSLSLLKLAPTANYQAAFPG